MLFLRGRKAPGGTGGGPVLESTVEHEELRLG